MWAYLFGESQHVETKSEIKDENKKEDENKKDEIKDENKKDEYLYLLSIDGTKNLIFNTKEKAEQYVFTYAEKYTCMENYYLYLVVDDCFNDIDKDVYKIMKYSNIYLISYDTHVSTLTISKVIKME